ncbi:MAG: transcriptional regulator, TetR family [Frankiales bacterium]|nr:transcriptional regulator, TetR family [Frankiales bacterium]
MTTGPGLRESKKLATRAALARAALRLAAERGVDGVTVEDVAAEAGVSPRTFFNHFATKEQAFVDDDLARGRAFLSAVAAGPPDADVWQLLRSAALATFVTGTLPDRDQLLKEQLVRTSPAVLAQVLASYAALEQELVVELGRRTGDPAGLRPRLLANGVVAVARAATETWLATDGASPDAFAALLDEGFTALAPAFSAV